METPKGMVRSVFMCPKRRLILLSLIPPIFVVIINGCLARDRGRDMR